MTELNVENRTLFSHDNLPVMREINSESIDLIYLDPPFKSDKNYAAPIGSQAAGAAFTDTWSLDDVKKEWVEEIQVVNQPVWAAITAAGFTHSDNAQAYLTYMAIRLIEVQRILKKTGSVYLHCDPTMSHYLKLLMDALFGAKNYRNEIVWCYTGPSSPGMKNFPRKHDTILRYSQSGSWVWHQQYIPYAEGFAKKTTKTDANIWGRTDPIELIEREKRGKPVEDWWQDVKASWYMPKKERTGWPTQKPLALVERIIKASSNPGDVVLDPFCGCATACVAAEKLGRQWIGIDIEREAYDIVISRLEREVDQFALLKAAEGTLSDIIHLTEPPRRTDADMPRRSPNIKEKLFRQQQGRCAAPCGEDGRGRDFPIDIFHVDHIRPTSKYGQDIDSNLQLLCPPCNMKKGNRTMAHLLNLLEKGGGSISKS